MKRQAKTSGNKELKISFLIAAHNEEKIIFQTLENLANLPYDNYEVIIGLDGCTDGTEKIVKSFEMKSKRFKHFNLNLRQGKPAVINTIIEQATGDIVIINDADWIFQVKDKQSLREFISIFQNKKIGGISENNALEFEKSKMKSSNLGFKMVAYSSQLWYEYQKKTFTRKEGNLLHLNEPTMFLTNIFRRTLYKPNLSLGDDFERTRDIMDSGYQIVISQNEDAPRFVPVYDKISIKDLFKLKMRTSIAREQLKETKMPLPKNYYFSSVFYIFKNSWKYGIKAGLMVSYWIFLTTIATFISKIKSKFKKTSTKEGWKMRAER